MRLSFTEHPASVGETYLEHFWVALGFAGTMLRGGLACAVHAVFPFLFVRTGSETIRALYQRMLTGRARSGESVEHLLGAGI
jgi:hypothetical protein